MEREQEDDSRLIGTQHKKEMENALKTETNGRNLGNPTSKTGRTESQKKKKRPARKAGMEVGFLPSSPY